MSGDPGVERLVLVGGVLGGEVEAEMGSAGFFAGQRAGDEGSGEEEEVGVFAAFGSVAGCGNGVQCPKRFA